MYNYQVVLLSTNFSDEADREHSEFFNNKKTVAQPLSVQQEIQKFRVLSPVPKSKNITPILRPGKLSSSAWLACKGQPLPSAYVRRDTFDLITGLWARDRTQVEQVKG